MPDFVTIPKADYDVDPKNLSNAVFTFGATSPVTQALTNDVTYRTREILFGPASAEFTPVAASSMSATLIGHYNDPINTQTPTFNTNLTSLESGDKILLVVGTNASNEPAVTVGGVSVGAAIANTGAAATGAQIQVFEYTATGAEGASVDIVATYGGVTGSNVLTLVRITGATRDSIDTDVTNNELVNAVGTVTPAGTPNLIVAVAQGRESFFGGHNFINAAQSGAVFTGSLRSAAAAFASNVPVAALAVEFDPNPAGGTSDEAAFVVVAYS